MLGLLDLCFCSSGHESYCYQLFVEKDELVSLPTTQHLLGMSFYEADLKFNEVSLALICRCDVSK
jgi:ubiquitin carboxyl-terminal hydrolase CYLD